MSGKNKLQNVRVTEYWDGHNGGFRFVFYDDPQECGNYGCNVPCVEVWKAQFDTVEEGDAESGPLGLEHYFEGWEFLFMEGHDEVEFDDYDAAKAWVDKYLEEQAAFDEYCRELEQDASGDARSDEPLNEHYVKTVQYKGLAYVVYSHLVDTDYGPEREVTIIRQQDRKVVWNSRECMDVDGQIAMWKQSLILDEFPSAKLS